MVVPKRLVLWPNIDRAVYQFKLCLVVSPQISRT